MKINQILLALCYLAMAACENKAPPKPQIQETYKTVRPLVKTVSHRHEYVADIQSVNYVEVRTRVKGYLEKIYVDEGQQVKTGQLLFTLNFSEFEKEVQKANAAYKSAVADLRVVEVELGNVRILVDKNIVSKVELTVLEAKADALKAEVEEALLHKQQATLQLNYAHIKAPYSGTLNRIPKKVGSVLAEGDILTSISDSREVFAYFNLSEIDYLSYRGDNARLTGNVRLRLADHTLYPHPGKIEMIESEIDHTTGNIAIRARFPNPQGLLKHGANAKVVISEELQDTMLIPQKSTFEIQDKLYVFVVSPEGVLQQRNVIPHMPFPDFYAIQSGLNKDEKILFEGVATAKEGQRVEAVEVDIASVMPVME